MTKIIEKIFPFVMAIILIFGVTACSSTKPTVGEEAQVNEEAEVSEQESSSVVEEPDFRKVRWGMSIEEVKTCEMEQLKDEDENGLLYRTKILGCEADLSYRFNDNGELYSAKYIFDIIYTNYNSYITHYKESYDALNEKYGKTTDFEDGFQWSEALLYKYNEENWGIAISNGDLSIQHSWDTQNAIVTLSLAGNNSEIEYKITYESKLISKPKQSNSNL